MFHTLPAESLCKILLKKESVHIVFYLLLEATIRTPGSSCSPCWLMVWIACRGKRSNA